MSTKKTLHLKNRNGNWHYYRVVPKRYRDNTSRHFISFSLHTTDLSLAKIEAARISAELEAEWFETQKLGISLNSLNKNRKYQSSCQIQRKAGFEPNFSKNFTDNELIERLIYVISNHQSRNEQKAILGLVQAPETNLYEALERFWDYIKDEWILLSHDQKRVKKNIYLRSIANFEKVVGKISIRDLN